MKKLISLLMAMLMLLGCTAALAEDVIGGADEATNMVVAAEESNLLVDGLLVTTIGLAGVFLVLILFFLMIKIMGKMLK